MCVYNEKAGGLSLACKQACKWNGFLRLLAKTTSTILVCVGFRDDFSAQQQTDSSHSWEVQTSLYIIPLVESVGPSACPIVLFGAYLLNIDSTRKLNLWNNRGIDTCICILFLKANPKNITLLHQFSVMLPPKHLACVFLCTFLSTFECQSFYFYLSAFYHKYCKSHLLQSKKVTRETNGEWSRKELPNEHFQQRRSCLSVCSCRRAKQCSVWGVWGAVIL